MLLLSDDGRFTIVVPRVHLREMLSGCTRARQNETGGILVGVYSADGECATVTAVGSAPEDSEWGGTWFRRGVRGIAEWLSSLWRAATPTYYLGEWHFHPFASPLASGEDVRQLRAIARDRRYRCPEPILLIIGGDPKAEWQIEAYVATASEVIHLRQR